MATDNSLQITITANAKDAETALNRISTLSKTTKKDIDNLASSADKASASFTKLADASKALSVFKRAAGGKNAFGLEDTQSAITKTNQMLAQLKRTGDKFGQNFGKNLKSGLNSALKEFKQKAGSIKLEVKTVDSSKRTKTRNSETDAIEKNTKALNNHAKAVENYGFTDFISERAERWGSKFFGEIAHLQEKRARVSAWNLTLSEQKQWNKQVKQLLADNKLITEADAESMMMAAASSIGHYDPHIVGQTVARATKFAQMERAMGYNKSEIDDIAKNYYGVAEARQVANDVEKTLKTFETVFRITTTSSGKITVADVETILRNLGPGAATLSDEGLLRLLAYAEQIKVAGRGQSGSTGAGISTVGTTTKMLQLMAMGKPSALGAKRMVAELGVMDDEVYRIVGDRVELVLNGLEDESNRTEREFARQIFQRGEYGQVLGQAVITGDLARAGVFDKQLAQVDPVRWVQNLVPLIKQYTASEEKRGSYYGQKGLDAAGMSTEEFMKTLTESDYLSAITSFWAKTGLSQRVINAFAIFSNEAFQHRSAAMLNTATRQKDVDALMLEQIENGNLNIAFLRAEKALNNFIQSFEPFGALVGKITYQVSGFIDLLTKWSKEWETLSTITAAWGTAKVLQSVGSHTASMYNLLGQANAPDKNAKAKAKSKEKASAGTGSGTDANRASKSLNPFVYVMSGFDKLNNKGTSVINKLKSGIMSLGGVFSRMLGGVGFAILAVDFASVLAQMAFEYTDWGKKFKAWWDNLAEDVKNNPTVLSFIYDTEANRSEKTNEEIAKLTDQINEMQAYNSARYESDDLSAEEIQQMARNEQAIREKKAERERLSTQNSTAIVGINKIVSTLEAQLKAAGLGGARDQLKTAEVNLANAQRLFDETKKVYDQLDPEAKKEGSQAQKDYNDRYQDLLKAQQELTKARTNLEEILSMKGVREKYAEIEKFLKDLKGTSVLYSVTDALADSIKRIFGNERDTGDTIAYSVNNDSFSVESAASQEALKARARENEAASSLNRGASGLTKEQLGKVPPKIVPGATNSDIQAYMEKLNSDIAKASAPSKQRFGFDSDEELWERARLETLADAEAGKLGMNFSEWRSKFFKDNVDTTALARGYTNADDYDFNKVVDGVRLGDVAKKKMQLMRLQKYNSTFGSLGINAENTLLDSQRNLARAQASRTAVGEAGLPNQTYQTSLQDLFQLQAQLQASGIKNAQQDQALNQRRLAILNQTFAQALQLERQYNDNAEQTMLEGMTEKERQQWEYARQAELTQATFNAVRQSMEESYNRWVANNQTASDEEKLQKQEEYQKRSTELQEAYNEEQKRLAEEAAKAQNEIDMTPLGNKIEEWQNVNLHMQTLQNEFMEGFVEANEKWLDGDEDSWREYGNNLLKTWRNIVLKMGYSKLLGGIAETATAGIGSFLSGVFGLSAPSIIGTSKDTSSTSTETAQNSTGFGFGKSIYEFFAGNGKDGENGFGKLTEKLKSTFTDCVDWLGELFNNFDFSKFSSSLTDVFSGIGDWLGSLFSDLDLGGMAGSAGNWISSLASSAATYFSSFFANGGVMTSKGPLPLNTYANGGIAKSAQVAVFGEGSRPEAYVPLPDGRSIPVTMSGYGSEMSGGNNINISINVTNNQGDTTETSSNSGTSDASNMKKLANNIKSLVKQEIVNQSRPGGLLYNNR